MKTFSVFFCATFLYISFLFAQSGTCLDSLAKQVALQASCGMETTDEKSVILGEDLVIFHAISHKRKAKMVSVGSSWDEVWPNLVEDAAIRLLCGREDVRPGCLESLEKKQYLDLVVVATMNYCGDRVVLSARGSEQLRVRIKEELSRVEPNWPLIRSAATILYCREKATEEIMRGGFYQAIIWHKRTDTYEDHRRHSGLASQYVASASKSPHSYVGEVCQNLILSLISGDAAFEDRVLASTRKIEAMLALTEKDLLDRFGDKKKLQNAVGPIYVVLSSPSGEMEIIDTKTGETIQLTGEKKIYSPDLLEEIRFLDKILGYVGEKKKQ